MEDARMRLIGKDEHDLATLPLDMARSLAEDLGVVDNGFDGPDDLRERLLLMKMKMRNSGHKPFFQFSRVQAEAATKRRNLLEILRNITDIFSEKSRDGTSSLLTEALSQVLFQEKLLNKRNLLDELTDRKRALQAKETLIIVAGETNSGKSTYLNVLLGQNVLPTDVLHCTYVVCKIVYSHSYVVETLDYQGHCEEYHCYDCDEARAKLKDVVTCDNLQRRQHNSCFKEITLKMPAEILKSGITLVDTPGIGENKAMDGVTINFVREAQASAFIYIIKSDGAGGVQEDRLLAFLRAVKENYKNDRLEGTFDPQAAMFVCHRWDTINPSEAEKVRRNALMKLEMVWPGFRPSQTFLFSSKKAKLHLDIDPDFITDSFNDLLNGMKQLIDRATHNAIKYQYCWTKIFLQPACRHLRSMISHCTINKDDLDEHFRDVADKHERLMKKSDDHVPMYEKKIADQKAFLRSKVKEILSMNEVKFSTDFDDYDALLSTCEEDKFLLSSENRRGFDRQIVTCLIKYCDDYLLREDILKPIEDCILQEIKEHLGLLEEQIKQIKLDIQGTEIKKRGSFPSLAGSVSRFSLNSSYSSNLSLTSEADEVEVANIPDPDALNQEVDDFLRRRKPSGAIKKILNSGPKLGKRIFEKMGTGGSSISDPRQYLDNQIRKLAAAICGDESIVEGFVTRYLQFSERCLKHAINCIPHFIAVNTELMNKIREHREAFLKDKQLMKEVMEKLEPHRVQLQGYGFLYMEDVHAEQINFIVERRSSCVQLQPGLMVSTRPNDDYGFVGSGSTRTRARGFWTHIQNARMNVDSSLVNVTIKTYSFIPQDSEQYSEIAALRCLEHVNVASFFGMTRIDGTNAEEDETKPAPRMPAFIFKGQLWAANVYRKVKFLNIQEFVPTFLSELWQGLDFIHMEHLVHLELNLDTVMVDSQNGRVKLCQQCKPREARLPADLSCKTKAAVCLSPSVLQGNVYQISDDIYAYGLLLWELLYPKSIPFQEERDWPLEKFIEDVHPSKMLKPALESLDASPAVKTLLDGCLIYTKGTIITMKDISRELLRFKEDIDCDPAITSLRNPRSKPLESRSNSSLSFNSDELPAQSMDEPNVRTIATVETRSPSASSHSYNDHQSQNSYVTISGEKPSRTEILPQPPPRRNRRPQRHSVTVAPDIRDLEVPAHHKNRKISMPDVPFRILDEQCQRFEPVQPTRFAGETQTGMDDERRRLKGMEKIPKETKLRNGIGIIDDPQKDKRHNAGIIPPDDHPDKEVVDFHRSQITQSIQSSDKTNPLSTAIIANNLKNPPQIQREGFAESESVIVVSNSTKEDHPPMHFANEDTTFPSPPGSRHFQESLTRYYELDSTDGSSNHFENDLPVQSHSAPHERRIDTSAVHDFKRQRRVKQLRRCDALRVSPSFQKHGYIFCKREGRRSTEGDVKPLLEEENRYSWPSRSKTFTSGDHHDFIDVDLLQQSKTEVESSDDTIQVLKSGVRKSPAEILILEDIDLTSDSPFNHNSNDAVNVTDQENVHNPQKALFAMTNCSESSVDDYLSYQPDNQTELLGSGNSRDSAYQSRNSSSVLTNIDEYELSMKKGDDELSESSCLKYCSLSPNYPVLNSAATAFPCVDQWHLDNPDPDTTSIHIDTDNLPRLDVEDLSF